MALSAKPRQWAAQPSAGRGTLVSSSVQKECPDLAPPKAVREGFATCSTVGKAPPQIPE